MNRNLILEIVDQHSGGLKGLELMSEIMLRIGPETIHAETFFDEVALIIEQEIPELGLLRYVHQLDARMAREKIFVYRKELDLCERLP